MSQTGCTADTTEPYALQVIGDSMTPEFEDGNIIIVDPGVALYNGAYAVIATFIAENYPADLRATATSFSGSFAVNLGLGLGPFALSEVIVAVNWEWAFTFCAVIPVCAAGCIFLALKPVPRETL